MSLSLHADWRCMNDHMSDSKNSREQCHEWQWLWNFTRLKWIETVWERAKRSKVCRFYFDRKTWKPVRNVWKKSKRRGNSDFGFGKKMGYRLEKKLLFWLLHLWIYPLVFRLFNFFYQPISLHQHVTTSYLLLLIIFVLSYFYLNYSNKKASIINNNKKKYYSNF